MNMSILFSNDIKENLTIIQETYIDLCIFLFYTCNFFAKHGFSEIIKQGLKSP